MGGLTSALLLAREGFKVVVLEQHYRPGGCLHRFFRDKVPYDTGFHYLGGVDGEGTMGRYLRCLGVDKALSFHPLDPDGFDILQFPQLTFAVPNGWTRLVERLNETFPRDRAAIATYAAACQQVCRESPVYSFVPSDPTATGKFARVALGPFLRSLTDDAQLRAVLAGQSMLYGIEPERTPFELHALVIDSMLQGAVGLDGGGDALARAMVQAIKSHGGTVRTRAQVVALGMEGNQVGSVALASGEVLHARYVISSAHPRATLKLLPEGAMRKAYVDKVEAMRESISCLAGYFTTTNTDAPRRRHNLYSCPSLDLDELYRTGGFGEGQAPGKGLFLTFPSDREADWKGPRVVLALALMRYEEVQRFADSRTGDRGAEYEALKAHFGDQLQVAVEAALPEHQGQLERIEMSTPLTNRDYTGAYQGSIYGISHALDQWGRYGLHPRTRIDNLLLTGQSVMMPGVLGVTVGAFVTCSFLLGYDAVFSKMAQA